MLKRVQSQVGEPANRLPGGVDADHAALLAWAVRLVGRLYANQLAQGGTRRRRGRRGWRGVHRAVVLCDGETVHAQHLLVAIRLCEYGGMSSESLEEAVNAYERDLIQNALRSTRGSRSKAARLLKTTYRVLHYKTRKYGIDYRRFKA